jgi:hypothetical protein
MILDAKAATRGLTALDVEDFTAVERRAVFQCMARSVNGLAAGEVLEAPALHGALSDSGLLHGTDWEGREATLVAELMECASPGGLTSARLRRLKDATARRRALGLLERAWSQVRENGTDLVRSLSELHAELGSIADEASRASNPFLPGWQSAAELLAAPLKPPPFLIEGILAIGQVGILGGVPGSGKTWAVLQLAKAVAGGTEWCGLRTHRGRVAAVLLETPPWAAQERLRAIGDGGWLRDVVIRTADDLGVSTIDICMPAVRDHLVRWVRAERAQLLILDPMSFVHGLDENKAHDAIQLVGALKQVAMEADVALLCPHHERKSASDGTRGSDLDALRGSSALVGGVGLVMRLADKQGRLCLSFPKVQSGPSPKPIYLARGEAGPLELTEAPEAAADAKMRNKVVLLESLDYQKAQALGDLVKALAQRGVQTTDRTVRTYLRELEGAGEVGRFGRGMYVRLEHPASEQAAAATAG